MTMQKAGQSSLQYTNLEGILPSKKDQAITKREINDLDDKSIQNEKKFNNMSCKDQWQEHVL